jgi:sugar lactone lactonase YvrE
MSTYLDGVSRVTISLATLILAACGGGGGAAPTYSVGGTVSGLSGSGLAIRNIGGSDLTITASGPFTIASSVANGTTYDVIVQAQPSGFTTACVVSDGSGTVGSSNVTDVIVSCHPAAAEVALLAGSPVGALDITGEALDVSGNLYFMNAVQNEILKVAPTGEVSVYAGGPLAGAGYSAGLLAGLSRAGGFAVDSAGNIYVADAADNEIREISPTGVITTLAGSTAAGNADGAGYAASFRYPEGIAVDNSGAIYVADTDNNQIRKITPSGVVTTIAGNLTPGGTDGTGSAASFDAPSEVFAGLAGTAYVVDNNGVRVITSAGVVTTRAGPYYQAVLGSCEPTLCSGGYAIQTAITVDALGNVYAAADIHPYGSPGCCDGTEIWMTTPAGSQHLVAGNEDFPLPTDGTATAASFGVVGALLADTAGVMYAVDSGYEGLDFGEVRMIDPAGVVTTPSARWNGGDQDGTGAAATFTGPSAVASDAFGNVYVLDDNEIRKITPTGVVTTLAGSPASGYNDGAGSAASFASPEGITVDAAGYIYVADTGNNVIRKITPDGVVTTLAGNSTAGNVDGAGSAALFYSPEGIAVDAAGYTYVADNGNNEIRKITPDGVVTTLAGNSAAGNVDGAGSVARFYSPEGIAVDAAGYVYVADNGNNEMRKIAPAGLVTTLAGSSAAGNMDGAGSAAGFNNAIGIAVDAAGYVYVADTGNNEIRKITPTGTVTTLAGTVTAGKANGLGSAARFDLPSGVTTDRAGNLYVADSADKEIRKIAPH